MKLSVLLSIVDLNTAPMGLVSSISGLQGAVSNKAVLDEVILDLSTVGLSEALSGMFGVDEEAFKVHPESAYASSDIAVINAFLRRALVTALVEQNIRISERMQSGLVPFSVSACSSFNQDVLWGLPHKFAFLMVAARVRNSAGSLVYLVPPFQRSALIYAASLPAEDPRVEAVRCDTLRAVKTLGIPMQDAEDFSDDDDGVFEKEQGVLVRTAREVLALCRTVHLQRCSHVRQTRWKGGGLSKLQQSWSSHSHRLDRTQLRSWAQGWPMFKSPSRQTQCTGPRKRCSR